jgi:hypothetical protein
MQRYQRPPMAAAAAQLPSSPKVISAPCKTTCLSSQQQQLNLPPSIPLSLDGEEGAKAYTQHLLQCNIDFKPECYQAPPNRTIQHRLSDETDLFGDPEMQQRKPSLASYKMHSLALTSPKVQARKGALPAVPYQAQMTPYADSDTGDYVSSSLLSSWRSMSSDRTAGREFTSVPVPGAAKQQPQQRSSSADSVKRIVKRFFSKKLRVLSLKTDTHSSSERGLFDTFDELSSGAIAASASSYKPDRDATDESRWDLPPNYVDMIFTKDPITNESQSDVIDDESSSKCGSFN